MMSEEGMEKREMARREFLKGALVAGAAAGASFAIAGCGRATSSSAMPTFAYPTGPAPEKWDYEADVVVIGAGTGMGAALTALEAGASVIVLEKWLAVGGDWGINDGVLYASGTVVQKEKGAIDPRTGKPDTPDSHFNDWWGIENGLPNEKLLRMVVDRSAGSIEYFVNLGLKFEISHYESVFPVDRQHQVSSKNGGELTQAVYKDIVAKGAKVMTDTRATSLMLDSGGKIVGVVVIQDGQTKYVGAKAVIVATGDAGYNDELIARYNPETADFTTVSGKWATGDGVDLLKNAGAGFTRYCKLERGDFAMAFNGQNIQTDLRPTEFPGPTAFIYVNKKAVRELVELQGLFMFGNSYSYPQHGIFDQTLFDDPKFTLTCLMTHSSMQNTMPKLIDQGMVKKADTIADLAKQLFLDPAALEKTIADYNASIAAGSEDPLGRPLSSRAPIAKAPFYGYKAYPCGRHVTVCPDIDEKLQVRSSSGTGTVIPGLYCAGLWMIRRIVCGDNYPGGGTYAMTGFVTSQVAGENAAAYVKTL